MPNSFDQVLEAAVDDIMRNGFDSQERIDRWMMRLREAARASMIRPDSMEQTLRDALVKKYQKAVDQGGLLALNPGVDRFTLERIKPSLRPELDRRIAASANLIRLNRAQAIEKTLQRFSGWSTSIPKGGASGESKREVKKAVRKSLAQLPFEERRVLIDQGHKLVASISEVVATDGGAIAVRWRSHWRQAGYDYREDHKERDGQIYLVRDSWADDAGFVKKGGNPYYDQIEAFGQLPFCRCYGVWLYNLRELPDDMITAKGRAALQVVRGREEVRAARTGRADDASGKVAKEAALYAPVWINRQTRCRRCAMFMPLRGGNVGNACTAVEGDVNASGHCKLFKASGRADAAPVIGVEGARARIEHVSEQLRRLT